jgi:acyl-CoA thioester hydrolase
MKSSLSITKSIRLRVRAGDTDYTGFVFNARVVEWFSIGRIETLRSRKITYLDDGRLAVDGRPQDVSLVVGEVYVRFHSPAKYDDLVQLQTRIIEVRNKTIKFEFEVRKASDRKILATGSSTSVCIDRRTVRSANIPNGLAERLRS